MVAEMGPSDSSAPRFWSGTARVVRGQELVDEKSTGPAAGPDSQPGSPGIAVPGRLNRQAGVVGGGAGAGRPTQAGSGSADRSVARRGTAGLAGDHAAPVAHPNVGLGHCGDIPGLPSMWDCSPAREDL